MQATDLVGTPYKDYGRDADGMDCFGLLVFWYRHVLHITLDDFHYAAEEVLFSNFEYMIDRFADAFNEVIEPRMNDVLVFQDKHGNWNHVAIYLNDGRYLHCLRKHGVVISNLKEPPRRQYRIYRYAYSH